MVNLMSKITDQIYVGDQQDASNEHLYKMKLFDCIINLNDRESEEELKLVKKYNILYASFNIFREKEKVAGYLWGAVEQGRKVLVHCEAGIDRSPFLVALYFSKKNNILLSKAYNIVKYFRPQTFIHLEWE